MDNYEKSLLQKLKRDTLIGVGIIALIMLVFLLGITIL